MKKIHLLCSDQVKKMSLGQSGKNGPKTQFGLNMAFFYLIRKSKVIFFSKKITFCFLAMSKNAIFSPNWVFGPFLLLWPSDIFLTWSENKKWFFSQKNHFLFSEQTILMGRKGGNSNNPKRFWHILLLRPDVGDFKTWIFWTS